ncbi:MAG: hypothetical protein V1898_02465 [Patescibacteria group bacterium]
MSAAELEQGLESLKDKIGAKKIEYRKMDEIYFTRENIYNDLCNFAGDAEAIPNLNSVNAKNTRATCSNNEEIHWLTYIKRFLVASKMATDSVDAKTKYLQGVNALKAIALEYQK